MPKIDVQDITASLVPIIRSGGLAMENGNTRLLRGMITSNNLLKEDNFDLKYLYDP